VPRIQDSLPDNNLPEFFFTEREINELENEYSFDYLREEIIKDNRNYGEFERCYKDYLERSLTVLNDEIYTKGYAYLRDEIEVWTRQVYDNDTRFKEHLLIEASEATDSGIDDSDLQKLCELWVTYIIQEDP
jgi:hypothetical protein